MSTIFNKEVSLQQKETTKLGEFVELVYGSNENADSKLFHQFHKDFRKMIQSPPSELIEALRFTLPTEFYASCINTATYIISNTERFFSPLQTRMMSIVQSILTKTKGRDSYQKYLDFFSLYLIPQFQRPNVFLVYSVSRSGHDEIAVLKNDGNVDFYSPKSIYSPKKTYPYSQLEYPDEDWKQMINDFENNKFSPSKSFFTSVKSVDQITTLPVAAYSAFCEYIISPDMSVLSALFARQVMEIDNDLITIFKFYGIHHRLVKYCVCKDVFKTIDEANIMRSNLIETKIIIGIIKNELEPFFQSIIIPLKTKLCAIPTYNLDSKEDFDLNIIDYTTSMFIDTISKLLTNVSLTTRFICRTIYDECLAKYKEEKYAQRGVFMIFFFRVLFPMICQPQDSDPPEIVINIQNSTLLPKLLTMVFSFESSNNENVDKIAEKYKKTIAGFFEILTNYKDSYDIIERPSFMDVMRAVDNIRKRAMGKIDDLIAYQLEPSLLLNNWLNSLVLQKDKEKEKEKEQNNKKSE
ncbi:hypothetical protein GPJ56_001278 [Histomonas meleagridis]|uniref:uncharacterized protein n=1 Tax=Histomonas meleagridis TaxID=135588 RepID=UPI003559928E|nr:hypothetical protein GPJ56_001278 [Histomonas meleagridis]KAH0805035.1 hypothetical protein GO595_001980 [Histomonas meleagridis]